MNPNLMNGSNLAYIGDAYYELRVREYLLSLGITKNIWFSSSFNSVANLL